MSPGGSPYQNLDATLLHHLHSWGLREFQDEDSYYDWQRATLPEADLQVLQELVEQRQGGENVQADIQFYDLLAKPLLLSVLYSQRFDYFRQLGLLIFPRLSSAQYVLDFGCGVGILPCFFAEQYPNIQFVGIDRSARSIETAKDEAKKRSLQNIQFRVSQEGDLSSSDQYDCILSTQALLQSEHQPGLPSEHWQTFERAPNSAYQDELEHQTGLDRRLESIFNALSADGRLICFEKTWNLGRRIFFQRALRARLFFPIRDPIPCSYRELGESRVDGPLYEVKKINNTESVGWSEVPYFVEGETVFRCVGDRAKQMSKELFTGQQVKHIRGQHASHGTWTFRIGVWENVLAWGLCVTDSGYWGLVLASMRESNLIFQMLEKVRLFTDGEFEDFLQREWGNLDNVVKTSSSPGYENHFPSATEIYEALPQKNIQEESTFSEDSGREMHIEIGKSRSLVYLYWANTFDQRQLVLVEETDSMILQEYYKESLQAVKSLS